MCRVQFLGNRFFVLAILEGLAESFEGEVLSLMSLLLCHFVYVVEVSEAACLLRVEFFAWEDGPRFVLTHLSLEFA